MRSLPLRALLGLCAVAALAGCTRARQASGARTRARADAGPRLELPEVGRAPSPQLARRVLHLFHTSNVAAELDPCG